MNKEIRIFDPGETEIRAGRRGRTIDGFPIVFDKLSRDLGGFREIIKQEAVAEVLDKSDILFLLNHEDNRGLLGRSTNGQGSLQYSIEKRGVKINCDAPDTALGDEVLSGIRRGDIRTMSFAFSCSDGQDWEKQEDGTYIRTITKFDQIYDVSVVYREAYPDTSVAVRKLVEITKNENTQGNADLEKEQRASGSPSDSTKANETEKRDMDLTKLRKETLKDGTVIAYEDWLSKGTQVFTEKDGIFQPAPDGTMTVREREEVYTSSIEMTIKDGFVAEIKSSSTSVSRKQPEHTEEKRIEPEDLTEYFKKIDERIKNM